MTVMSTIPPPPVLGPRPQRWPYSLLCISLIGLSVLLFVISLALDGFYLETKDPRAWSPCIWLLLFGWMGLFAGMVAWLANPVLFFAWICMAVRPLRWGALAAALLALLLALTFLLHTSIITDEGGGRANITGYGLGYWFWLASMIVALLGSIVIICLKPPPFRTLGQK